MKQIIPIKMIPSAGIRAALVANGDTYATKIATFQHWQHAGETDWNVILWKLPSGEMVLETNGDPIFQTQSPDDFDEVMDQYEEVAS
jgi:hypothetical protein